jgi:hypothetical protein
LEEFTLYCKGKSGRLYIYVWVGSGLGRGWVEWVPIALITLLIAPILQCMWMSDNTGFTPIKTRKKETEG